MSGKTAPPKTRALPQTVKAPAVRKATTGKAPASKATAPTVQKTATAQDKKAKKSKSAVGKVKVVRDSFTMPQDDYEKIGEFKALCLKSGMHVKKSELLRAGLHALGKLSLAQLKTALSELEKIETGRPKKS